MNFMEIDYLEWSLKKSDIDYIKSTQKDFKKNEQRAFERYQQLTSKQRYKTIYN